MVEARLARAFDGATVETVCRAIGDFYTGSDLTQVLVDAGLSLNDPGEGTKWRRLHDLVAERQNKHQNGRAPLALIAAAAKPTRLLARERLVGPDSGVRLRAEINQALSLAGYKVRDDGKISPVKTAGTVDEARERGEHLRMQLERRGCHAEVLAKCPENLRQDGYYDVVFESVKGLRARLVALGQIDLDGNQLVDATLGGKLPRIKLNSLNTVTDRNEQRGIADLARGVFAAFRNPISHEPRATWTITEQDALDVLGVISLVHRRLDAAF